MSEQYLKHLEDLLAVELGIGKTEFLRIADEIEEMVNADAPIQKILDKVNELQSLVKNNHP